jgi:hypothetical protein
MAIPCCVPFPGNAKQDHLVALSLTTVLNEVTMNPSMAAMMTGSAVLLFATIFVVGHYRREHRRARMLRQMALLWPYRG